ncbi:MAG: transposase [Deltaproteobacteria bacterium]|nr:transposase [Deltaproteobacteria bacterium]
MFVEWDWQTKSGLDNRQHTDVMLWRNFRHLLVDVFSGLMSAVTVTAGNRHDGSVAHRLIRRTKALYKELNWVLGDTAYGGARLRYQAFAYPGVRIVAPPPAVTTSKREHALKREDIAIDFENKTAICAAGINASQSGIVW